MSHVEFEPRTAPREEKRQAYEALGRSFCKTITELVTNSDSSLKRKLNVAHASGIVDLMFEKRKGEQVITSDLKAQLAGRSPRRRIEIQVVSSRTPGRQAGEVVVIDQGEGMGHAKLQSALEDIAGDRADLHSGQEGRNLFGRGLSDVLRAHNDPVVYTYDGDELAIARGDWRRRWTIAMDDTSNPNEAAFQGTFLSKRNTGTAVRIVLDREKCHIPQSANILYALANFSLLRLIAADPNVELILKQYRAHGESEEPIVYDFPVGQVLDSFSKQLVPGNTVPIPRPLAVDFLLARSDKQLRGLSLDREGRENGLLIIDDLDVVYDLTFADTDYEKADFLSRLFGVVRVNGLRRVLESCLNSAESPSSPLHVNRDGFNRNHEFGRLLMEFIAETVRPYYEKERQLAEENRRGPMSVKTQKRIDDALKELNKFFARITELSGQGEGPVPPPPKEPAALVSFYPDSVRLTVGKPRRVLLLVREEAVKTGGELIATASDGISVFPEAERVDLLKSQRWVPHPQFLCFPFSVLCPVIGQRGKVCAIVETVNSEEPMEATMDILDVLVEPEMEVPQTMEFRPTISLGRPGRRNTAVLLVNPMVIREGHNVKINIMKQKGDMFLFNSHNNHCDSLTLRLNPQAHSVPRQNLFRVLVSWSGTAWNQYAKVEACVKVAGPDPLIARATLRLDEPEPDNGGFFKKVDYDELDGKTPSRFAAGVVTVNSCDPLNRTIFGKGTTKEEAKQLFDRQLSHDPRAQQRLAALLLEEASFRALQHLHDENKVHLATGREIAAIHEKIDEYKYESAHTVYQALARE